MRERGDPAAGIVSDFGLYFPPRQSLSLGSLSTPVGRSDITSMNEKETWVAYLLWFFLGLLGVHKFYLRQTGWGIVYILTGGLFVVGWLLDLFTIPSQVRRANEELRLLTAGTARPAV